MVRFWSLDGCTSYESARELQLKLVDLRAQDAIPDTLLFLEHEPVITRGRGLQWTGVPRERHMPLPEAFPSGVAFCESERGGDLTYHGPGQLVIYPIVKLDGRGFGPRHDVAGFLRTLEQILIEELQSWGFEPESRDNATGVWIGGRKVASIGIAVRKWVTYHGIAINCVNDLKPFHLISPCGFNPEVMARVVDLMAERSNLKTVAGWDGQGWRVALENRLARRFQLRTMDPEAEFTIERMEIERALKRAQQTAQRVAQPVIPGLASNLSAETPETPIRIKAHSFPSDSQMG